MREKMALRKSILAAMFLAIGLILPFITSVKAEYTIDLPRPRDMVSDEFMNLRTKISENTDLSV